MTVTGPMAPEGLGFCQMHEHLYVSAGPNTQAHPELLIDNEALSAAELLSYRAAGGTSLVDAQPGGAGRGAAALRRLSGTSGVRIVAVTGFHLPAFYPPASRADAPDEDALCALFISELREGVIEGGRRLDIRAGAVKAAVGREGLDGKTLAKLRAAARAAAICDVPLLVHTEGGFCGAEAARLCLSAGLPARRVLICHADRQANDYGVHESIAETGAFLEYDTIGRFKYHDDRSECRLILHMISKGYEKQLLLSLDTTARRLAAYGGEIGLRYLIDSFLPSLRDAGVPEGTVASLTRLNPLRAFS